ncbi:hypothetical protein B0H12DRAFT_1231098 [Mycena haematopus]|nr:hypothetical protein B0H12DRAFT_1246058 [Mycena haematopus]KAJ7262652.1 hypothetical protein B0H12DRAFT_1231098 [Mycena haematopus]
MTTASVAGFKVPAAWDNNRPKFEGESVNSLKNFLRNCETIFKNGGVNDAQDKKDKLLEYVDDVDIREQWQGLATYKTGSTFDQWKEAILQLYPEIEDMAHGSLQKLTRICAANRPITRLELGKLRRFAAAFTTEAEKLLAGSALIVNLSLVDMVLGVLEPAFATELENAMNNAIITSITNPVAQVQGQPQNGLLLADRRGDRLPYKQVLEIADLIADNWVGRGAKGLLTGSSRYDTSNVGIAGGSIPSGLQDTAKIKTEVMERMESFAIELARIKDTSEIQERRFGDSMKRMEHSIENSMKQMNQALRDRPPHLMQDAPKQRSDESQGHNHGPGGSSSHGTRERGPCFFCGGPHLIGECVNKDELIDLGWIIVENGVIKLANGNWIPKYPEGSTRMQRVEDFYRKQGQTRNSASKPRASMMQSFYNGEIYGSDDPSESGRMDHLYDTRDDEIRSAKVQQMVKFRGGNQGYNMPVSQNYHVPAVPSVPYHNPYQNPHPGAYMVQTMPQFQQMTRVPEMVPNVPTVPTTSNVLTNGSLDLSQVIQLLNAIGVGNRSGTPVQEQLVATRSGAKSDPPAQPDF